jgi:hypothetical protein
MTQINKLALLYPEQEPILIREAPKNAGDKKTLFHRINVHGKTAQKPYCLCGAWRGGAKNKLELIAG